MNSPIGKTVTLVLFLLIAVLVVNAGVSFHNTSRLHASTRRMAQTLRANGELDEGEQRLLALREDESRRSYVTALATGFAAAALGMGIVLGSYHLIRNEVEARRCAEAEAGRQRDWCMTTLTSIADAVIVTDAGGRIKVLNPAAQALAGWDEAAAVGRDLPEVYRVLDETTRRPLENPCDRVQREGKVGGESPALLVARDGEERLVEHSCAPIHDERKEVMGMILVFRDVTERRRAEEQLRAADRRKNEFLATLAHELRNPLAPIRNAVEILRLLGPPDAKLQWARDVIERQTQHLTRLVDDLLDVSRIARGKVHLRKEPVDLRDVVARAVETSRPLIEARRHELQLALPSEPLPAEVDPTRVAQVLLNLLNNAAKYTPEKGRVTLRAERAGSEAVLRVRDNGAGIPPEMLPRIFDLFTQVDGTLGQSQGGLGIGLTLVRKLVELHGGSVQAFSEGAGKGSEFVVRLPLRGDAPPGESAAR